MATKTDAENSVIRFACELYNEVLKTQTDEPQNTLLSPASLYAACLVALAGAEDSTLVEMFFTLQVPREERGDQIHASIGKYLMNQLTSGNGSHIQLTNRLYSFRKFDTDPNFIKTLAKYYNSPYTSVAHMRCVDSKVQHINQDISEQTNSQVPVIIDRLKTAPDTMLLLVNVLQYKGLWQASFPEESTAPANFKCLDGTSITVPMMASTAPYPVADFLNLDAKAVKLPFVNEKWKLLIVLPFERDGLCKLLRDLQEPGKLAEVIQQQFAVEKTEVHFPRLKISQCEQLNYKQILQACGMRSLFEKKANLSNLSSNQAVHLNDIKHQSILEVSESGITKAVKSNVSPPPVNLHKQHLFKVDHPFFLAVLTENDVPVFLGHVIKPELIQ